MQSDSEKSLGDDATVAGRRRPQPQRADVSLGDERTLGDGLSGQETIIEDIEVVDLEARYKIEGTLGQGGMGAVMLATDTRLDRKVAIKRILGEAAGNRMAVNRFLTEAKSIAALNHQNIVQIYDYGRAKDGPFLIMEYVDGGSLLDRCREGALPLEDAVELTCQLCDGLAKAHDLGIIHRDIKPANVLLTRDGTPKLTDFGLAKAEAGDRGQTMTGAVLGTPDFMPPEQRRDASLVDARSDLWSLAATVYQMVTGRSPKIIRFDLLPAELTNVLGRALEDEKGDRYQSARELRDAIKGSLRTGAIATAEVAAEQGTCRACGAKNDVSRKFCRGCGGSLEVPCLSCDKPMSMWEEICGSCGAKQTPILEQRREQMTAAQVNAEGLLGDFEFDRATAAATPLRDEPHPRLTHLRDWAEHFLEQVDTSRTEQLGRAKAAAEEALAHEWANDYPAGIRALDTVPAVIRAQTVTGRNETAETLLARLIAKHTESTELDSGIREAVREKSLAGLLSKVARLAELRPDRADIERLQGQLEERERRLQGQRDALLGQAREAFERKDYAAAIKSLDQIDAEVKNEEGAQFRGRCQNAHNRSLELAQTIKAAVAEQRLDGLLETVDEYLTLKPTTPDLQKLRATLVERADRIEKERQASVRRALRRAMAGTFLIGFLCVSGLAGYVWYQRQMHRTATIAKALQLGRWDEVLALDSGNAVALLGRAQSKLRFQPPGIDADIDGAFRDIASAEQHDPPSEKLSEVKLAAFLARALARLAATPIDIDGAFDDIAAAEAIDSQSAQIKEAKVAAYVARAINAAKMDQLSQAETDLAEARSLGGFSAAVAEGRDAIASAWLAQAENALAKQDIAGMRTASAAAAKAGATPALVKKLWVETIEGCVKRVDAKGMEAACSAAREYGVDGAEEGAMWLRFADAAAKKGDTSAVRAVLAAAVKGGAQKERLKRVWEKLAESYVERLDAEGLEAECVAGKEYGLTSVEGAAVWLRFAETALKNGDAVAVGVGCDAAIKAGATAEQVRPTQVRGMVMHAEALLAAGEAAKGVDLVITAIDADVVSAVNLLSGEASKPLRDATRGEYRKRFDNALEKEDFKNAIVIAAAAARLDPLTESWLTEALTADRLMRLPSEALSMLPTKVVVSLPPIRNSIGMQLKLIPAGSFMMGEEDLGTGRDDVHRVTLTEPFFVAVTEVTKAQCRQVIETVPANWKGDDRPVEEISWNDAVELCQKLSALPKEREAGRVYRLPTEAEWEYACRAGSNTRYSFGADEGNLDRHGWYVGNSNRMAHPVAQKVPNPWGLYDVHGNVWELCSDFYAYKNRNSQALVDPKGPREGRVRVLRGGSCSVNPDTCGSGTRYWVEPSERRGGIGVRVVCDVE
jgi:formylglycine-generating enzyme required for sulfatase activity